jgi:hypothetical protein
MLPLAGCTTVGKKAILEATVHEEFAVEWYSLVAEPFVLFDDLSRSIPIDWVHFASKQTDGVSWRVDEPCLLQQAPKSDMAKGDRFAIVVSGSIP